MKFLIHIAFRRRSCTMWLNSLARDILRTLNAELFNESVISIELAINRVSRRFGNVKCLQARQLEIDFCVDEPETRNLANNRLHSGEKKDAISTVLLWYCESITGRTRRTFLPRTKGWKSWLETRGNFNLENRIC